MASTTDFLGKSKKAAQDLAEKRGLIFRLIRVDAEKYFDYPKDLCKDRICIEIENGVVVKAVMT